MWLGGFPHGSVVKNPPAMQETWIGSLRQEDPLEKEMAAHSNWLEYPMERGAWRTTDHRATEESDRTE